MYLVWALLHFLQAALAITLHFDSSCSEQQRAVLQQGYDDSQTLAANALAQLEQLNSRTESLFQVLFIGNQDEDVSVADGIGIHHSWLFVLGINVTQWDTQHT